jgi:hypothetical protein
MLRVWLLAAITTSVTNYSLPTAIISYAGTTFCKSMNMAVVPRTGAGGGINSSAQFIYYATDSQIQPSASTAGP